MGEKERARNIVVGIGSLSIQNFLNSILGFILLTFLLRFLPVSSYGVYSAVSLSVAAGSTISSWALGNAVVRFISRNGESNGYLSSSILLALTFTCSAVILFAAVSPFLSLYFTRSLSYTAIFAFGSLWILTSNTSLVLQSAIQGMRKYSLLALILLVSRILSVALSVYLVYMTRSVIAAIAGWIFNGLVVSLLCLPYIRNRVKLAIRREKLYAVLRYSTPIALSSIVSFFASNTDIILVGGYLNTSSLGIYNAAVTISSLLSLVVAGPLNTAFFSEISFSSVSPEQVSKGFEFGSRFLLLTVLPASFFLSAISFQLTELFSGGGSYLVGVMALQLITLFYTFSAFATICCSLFQGIGKTFLAFLVTSSMALVEVFLSFLLVPRLELVGASISRVGSGIFGTLVALYFTRGHGRIHDARFVVKAITASALPSSAVWIMSQFVSNSLITIVPYSAVALLIFLLSLRVLKVLSKEDREIIENALPRTLKHVVSLLS